MDPSADISAAIGLTLSDAAPFAIEALEMMRNQNRKKSD
jgi:hypothetical protein